jgi:hypothetical protein
MNRDALPGAAAPTQRDPSHAAPQAPRYSRADVRLPMQKDSRNSVMHTAIPKQRRRNHVEPYSGTHTAEVLLSLNLLLAEPA